MAASQMATFEGAFARLKDCVKPRHAIEFQSTTLKDVWDAANEIQRIQRQRRSLRNMGRLKPFLQGLEKYSKCIEIVCNGTPFLPWVWAPVKLVLQLASDHPTVLDKLLGAYSQIADALPRFDRFHSTFHYDANVKQALALVYEDILEFHRNTYLFFKRGAWHILFDSLWKDFGVRFLGILENLERHRDLVDKEASAIAIIEAKKWRAQQQDNLERLEGERRDRQLQDCVSWLAIDDRSQEDTLEKLSQRRQAGTCEWVLKSSQLRIWVENQNAEPVLWLKGIPGAGKSVLTSHVIQNLREKPDFTTIFFFCNSHTDRADLCSQILRTLILELLRSQPHLTGHIFEHYARQGRTPSLGQIKKLLPELLSAVSSVRIVIDGLDECQEKDQKAILTELLSAVKTSTSPCKIFVSSRAETFISKALRNRPTISLTEKREREKVDEDIQEYVRHSLMALRETFLGTLVDDVERTVVRKAQGMFLWVRLVISELSDRESAYELRKAAHNLPQGLHKAYRRILDRIRSEYSKYSSEKAILILQWMACSFRPLKTFEIMDGLVFATPDNLLDDDTKSNKSLLDLCKPIVEEGVGNSVDFVHFSAKEYILHQTSGPFLKECDAHLTVSFACASYLFTSHCLIDSRYSEEEQVLRVAKGFHGLHLYAHEFMLKHILRYAELQSISKLQFSEALATRMERLLQFEKPNISTGFNTALHGHTSLPDTVQKLSTLNLPPKLQAFIQNLLIFQEMSAQDNHHYKEPQEIHKQEIEYDPTVLSRILHQYHSITEFLIETSENAISGIDAAIVREFKNTYGDSALLCRYRPCPRASVGFSRVRDRDKHESTHCRKFKCADTTCEFHSSGFSTKSALQKHTQMYHRKSDEIVLPIRRRPRTTGLRERYLDQNDSSLGFDLYNSKLSQKERQKPWSKQQLGISFQNPQQDFATSQFRLQNERASYAANLDTTLCSEDSQGSLFRGKKINLSDYKERQLKNFDLRQAKRLRTTPSNASPPHTDAEEEDMDKVQTIDDTTYSRGGVPLDSNNRKKRKDYPSSWGYPHSPSQMKMEKRGLAVFNGESRFSNDLMLDTDYKFRTKSGTENGYCTDLEVQSIQGAEVSHDAIEENKGLWTSDDLVELDLKKLMEPEARELLEPLHVTTRERVAEVPRQAETVINSDWARSGARQMSPIYTSLGNGGQRSLKFGTFNDLPEFPSFPQFIDGNLPSGGSASDQDNQAVKILCAEDWLKFFETNDVYDSDSVQRQHLELSQQVNGSPTAYSKPLDPYRIYRHPPNKNRQLSSRDNSFDFLNSFFSETQRSQMERPSIELNQSSVSPEFFYPENSSEAGAIDSKESSDLKATSPTQASVRREPDWTRVELNDFERLREGQEAAQDYMQQGLPPGLKHGENAGAGEIFDPLSWMLDGLVDTPYSYDANATYQGT